MTKDGITREISIEELRAHDNDQEPWFVLNGEVYDGTAFLDAHPGGATSITGAAAQDATDEFMAIHSETAKAMMPSYHIGSLSRFAREALTSGEAASPESQTPRPIFLQPKTWQKALLASKKTISSDSRIFSFTLDHPEQEIGLPIDAASPGPGN
ncbi:nitrate reductase protein [Rutstroemia sp. NJR-2017a BBW]|nr:nitrate reductase protein [Rutstroemia sp. NJR-2017a BBW]